MTCALPGGGTGEHGHDSGERRGKRAVARQSFLGM